MEHFLGKIGITEYMAFIFFTIIGMGLVKAIKYNIKKKAGLRETPVRYTKFNFGLWADDNLLDFIIAFWSSFLFYRFFPNASQYLGKVLPIEDIEEKMLYGLILGLFFQYILHKLMNTVTVQKTIDVIK